MRPYSRRRRRDTVGTRVEVHGFRDCNLCQRHPRANANGVLGADGEGFAAAATAVVAAGGDGYDGMVGVVCRVGAASVVVPNVSWPAAVAAASSTPWWRW